MKLYLYSLPRTWSGALLYGWIIYLAFPKSKIIVDQIISCIADFLKKSSKNNSCKKIKKAAVIIKAFFIEIDFSSLDKILYF